MDGEILELTGTRLSKPERPLKPPSAVLRSSVLSIIDALRSTLSAAVRLLVNVLATLFPPRMPKLRRGEFADVTEYYERIARHRDAALHVPGSWFGRISKDPVEKMPARGGAENAPSSPCVRAA